MEGRRKKNKGGKRAPAVQVSAQVAIDTDTACVLSANALTRVPSSGDEMHDRTAADADALASQLSALLASGACACEHTCDQLVVFMALANGTSRLRAPPASALTSQHLPTVLHFAALLTGATFRLSTIGGETPCQVIECDGIGAAAATTVDADGAPQCGPNYAPNYPGRGRAMPPRPATAGPHPRRAEAAEAEAAQPHLVLAELIAELSLQQYEAARRRGRRDAELNAAARGGGGGGGSEAIEA